MGQFSNEILVIIIVAINKILVIINPKSHRKLRNFWTFSVLTKYNQALTPYFLSHFFHFILRVNILRKCYTCM